MPGQAVDHLIAAESADDAAIVNWPQLAREESMSTITNELVRESSFLAELASLEEDVALSLDECAVGEADVERRLLALRNRINSLRLRDLETPPVRRNAIALYSSRWCHEARRTLSLVQ